MKQLSLIVINKLANVTGMCVVELELQPKQLNDTVPIPLLTVHMLSEFLQEESFPNRCVLSFEELNRKAEDISTLIKPSNIIIYFY